MVEESEHDVFYDIEHGMGYHTVPYYFRWTYNVHCDCNIHVNVYLFISNIWNYGWDYIQLNVGK